jgi:hypothetical protein
MTVRSEDPCTPNDAKVLVLMAADRTTSAASAVL